ncbi:hypothetical protein RHMOL_Rhmol03G0126700 [Rhododendron molle]|uniref:Uncharacterized protein n=1 Tax=Rhododendron molle TaxID=49168 RepID=A0ACC0PF16_RHOML|nr:hypothetical protein RHMOL_Rhmol03G0126700 [Rhododendron molle]
MWWLCRVCLVQIWYCWSAAALPILVSTAVFVGWGVRSPAAVDALGLPENFLGAALALAPGALRGSEGLPRSHHKGLISFGLGHLIQFRPVAVEACPWEQISLFRLYSVVS